MGFGEKLFWRIEEITIRYIVLRLFTMRRVIIPNLVFVTTPVTTFSSEEMIRLETVVSVHYDTDLKKAIEVIKNALKELPYLVEKDNIKVMVDNFGESGIDIKVWYFFDPNKGYWAAQIRSDVNQKIFEAFQKEWIVIPYPHTVITVDKNDRDLIWTLLYVMKHWLKTWNSSKSS